MIPGWRRIGILCYAKHAMSVFLNFCQKHYYAGFVSFGIGGGIEILSPYLPPAFSHFFSVLGLLIMVLSAILLGIGLTLLGRRK
jgi:hypothetical protein